VLEYLPALLWEAIRYDTKLLLGFRHSDVLRYGSVGWFGPAGLVWFRYGLVLFGEFRLSMNGWLVRSVTVPGDI